MTPVFFSMLTQEIFLKVRSSSGVDIHLLLKSSHPFLSFFMFVGLVVNGKLATVPLGAYQGVRLV